jgi:FtsP/CotA-like multicopper oxidase with cupredoxin domain/transcriptional regulator CtsR
MYHENKRISEKKQKRCMYGFKFTKLISAFLVSFILFLSFGQLPTYSQSEMSKKIDEVKKKQAKRITTEDRMAAAARVKASQNEAAGLQRESISKMAMGDLHNPGMTPYYFGPYSNWANSPMPVNGATVTITGGGGTGAAATATVINGIVTDITLTSEGSGYTSAPVISITGGSGSGASATATLAGAVDSVLVTSGGSGYNPDTTTVSVTGDGTGAEAKAIIDATNGDITSVTLVNSGSGYKSAIVTIQGDGTGAEAAAAIDPATGAITGITVTNGGSGYTSATVTVSCEGTGAIATATVDAVSGVVNSITLENGGSGYKSAIVTIEGDGTGAVATASVDPATGTVNGIIIKEGGSGYTSATVIIKGEGSGAVATATIDTTAGDINGIEITNGGTRYTNATVAITGDGSGAVAAATVKTDVVSSLTLTSGGQGYLSGGLRKFVDSLPGLTAAKANNLGQYIPVAIPDTATYPGSDYYEISLVEYTEKMHSDLKPTTLRGYVQTNTTDETIKVPHYLGPMIMAKKDRPVRIKFTNKLLTDTGGDLFLPVDTTVMGAGMGPLGMNTNGKPMNYSQNRATVHLHGGKTPWISDGTQHQWITPAGENTAYPKGVSVQNVPDMPDPGDGSQTFYYTNQQSARLMFYHDHAYGITRLNVYGGEAAGYLLTDGVEQDLITNGIIPTEQIPLIIQDKTFLPDEATLKATDPTWPFPVDLNRSNLWLPHVYMPNQNKNDLQGVNPMGRWDYGPWFWPPWPVKANPQMVPNPYAAEPGQPQEIPNLPNISMGMENFMDTPLVNGTAYPNLTVEPKAYRFRILNAANDRFWNLQLYQAVSDQPMWNSDGTLNTANAGEISMVDADKNTAWPAGWPTPDLRDGGLPDPTKRGPNMIQIGTDGGFLPKPVVWENIPIGFDKDAKSMTVGNIKEHNLFIGPAERADVIVDFSAFAGKTLILYNDAPAAVPASDPRYDYYTGNPDLRDAGGAPPTQPGYGPNTRTVMQIRVAATTPANPFDQAKLEAAFASTPTSQGVFARSQEPIIVPQAAYNSAYNANFPNDASAYVRVQDTSLTFTPMGSTTPTTIQFKPKAIAEEFEDTYGRMSGFLGVEVPFTNGMNQTTIFYTVIDPATEIIDEYLGTTGDGIQIWKVTHNGVDTHPIHFHLFDVQLINRVDWAGVVKPPEPNELGWKDTVRMNPLEDCIVALRPVAPKQPFGIPDSKRLLDPTMPEGSTMGFKNVDPNGNPITVTNQLTDFGWEYVWHCHILSHEEMDMMRPIQFNVGRQLPAAPLVSVAAAGSQYNLAWTDTTPPNDPATLGNPANEIGFRIERADVDDTGQAGTYVELGKALANATTYSDATAVSGKTYSYRVVAYNAAGETASNPVMAGSAVLAPTDPTNLTAALQTGPQVILTWQDNATNETSYVIERSDTGANFIQIATANPGTGTGSISYTDTAVAAGMTYTYQVKAVSGTASSAYTNPATVTVPAAPAAPTNLSAALQTGPAVDLTWTDNATDETGFVVERSTNGGAFSQIAAPGQGAGTGNMSYSDSTVAAGNTYTYQVKAVNGAVSSTYTPAVTINIPAIPSAPTNLTATSSGLLQVTLAWMDNATDETGYAVERSANGGAYVQIASPGPSANTGSMNYIDLTVTADNTYTYRVKAINGILSSGYSNTAAVSILAVPGAPTNLSAALPSISQVNLTWTDNATGETGFVVERSMNGGAFSQIAAPGPRAGTGTTSYSDSTVAVGNTYTYQVKAVNGAVSSPYSNTATVIIPAVPAAPTNLSITSPSGSQISLTWTDNATDETGFVIERSVNGGAYVQLAAPGPRANTGSVSYTDSTVTAGNTYSYRVKAVNGIASSAYSNVASVSIATPPPIVVPPIIVPPVITAPASPTNLAATLQNASTISLTWSDNATNETGFVVERSVNGGVFTQIAAPGPGANTGSMSYTDSTVAAGSSYVYRVKAVNGTLSSAYSNTATVSIPAVPAAPTSLTATLRTGPQVSLTWRDNATNETGFVVERSVNGGAYVQITAPGPNTRTGNMTYVDRTAVTGNSYTYKVKAVNGIVSSAYSNTATVNIPIVMAAPTNLRATLQTGPQVSLTWQDNATNETGFVVERSVNGGAYVQIAAPGPNTKTGNMTYTDKTVAAGKTYTYRVKAVSGTASSTYSNTTSVSVPTPPAVPSRFRATAARAKGNSDTVTLRWTDNSKNETGFMIQRATNLTFTAGVATFTVKANTTKLTQSGLNRSTKYYYRIAAVNPGGNSTWINATPFPITTP